MAKLLLLDSFDHWDENDPYGKWGFGTDTLYWRVSASYGRHGAGIRINTGGTQPFDAANNNGNATLVQRKFFSGVSACIGVAFKLTEKPIPGNGWPFLQFLDSALQRFWLGAFDATQCAVWLLPSGRLRLVRGDFQSPTTLETSTATFRRNVWHYLEFKLTVHQTTGSASVKLDGSTVINFSGGDTQSTDYTRIDGFRVGFNRSGAFNNRLVQLDDLYVTDGDFLGDIKVEARRPTVDGFNQDWTPSAGALNYDMVDDLTPDESSTYNSGGVGDIDTFVTQDLVTTSGTVHGIQVCNYAHNLDFDDKTLQSVIRHSGSNFFGQAGTIGTHVIILNTARDYAYNLEGYLTDPGTSAEYTIPGFADDEYGYRRVS